MSKISIIGLSGESIFLKLNHLPIPSVTTHAKNCYIEPGGKGYNQAIACKKNGSMVSYLTKVGNDAYGKYCQDYMDKIGIDTNFIFDKKNKTALATILTDDCGENEVIVYPGAFELLNKEEVLSFKNKIISSDILLVQYEIPYEALIEIIKIAKENNVLIVLNPAPAKYDDKSLLNMADIITPNLEEAKTLFNVPSNIAIEELGVYLKDKVNNILIVTLGSKGCLLVYNHSYQYYESYKVQTIDTTGAGDIFNAGLASIINKDLSNIDEAIKYAQAASAISVTKQFVMNSIPSYEEVIKFQQLYNLKEKK